MIYVGIDIAKLNHFTSAISSDGEILIEPFKSTNDNDGSAVKSSRTETCRCQRQCSIYSGNPHHPTD